MQALNRRKENCRRSGPAEQTTDCIQKQKRLRCCGRVFSEQESVLTESGDNQTNVIGQGKRKGNRQLNNLENAQGRGLGNGQGRRKGNTQGRRMGNGQGKSNAQS